MDILSEDADAEKKRRTPGTRKDGITLTTQRLAFLDKAVEIEQEEVGELGFSTDFMTQTSLPLTEPTGPFYSRSNGKFKLIITPTFLEIDGVMTACYPYGVYPRRALIWIISEALRTDSPKVSIGATINEFMKKVGIGDGGGKRVQEVRRQLLALLGSPIRTSTTETRNGRTRDVVSSFLIATNADLWTENKPAENLQKGSVPEFQSVIELSHEFFTKLKKNGAVPLDFRAVDALGSNAMALDVYTWVSWRNHAAKGKDVEIRWETLRRQFGSEAKALRNFRGYFLKTLARVQAVYPGLVFESDTENFTLKPSLLAVEPRKPKKRMQ